MSRFTVTLVAGAVLTALFAGGCARGLPREERQVRIIPDMEEQKKVNAQSEFTFFTDGRSMRNPVLGTVARGTVRSDSAMYRGRVDGVFVSTSPLPITSDFMQRGRQRYDIYCAPCHDRTGAGNGIVITRAEGALPIPPTMWEQRVLDYADGQLFDIISNGIRNMPGYKSQIPPDDRWAVVSYVRALQRAQTATLADVPPSLRGEIR